MSASAPAVNSVTFVGHLTADPVIKQLDDDRKVCNLRLAVNDQKDQPLFIDVATFGTQAEACAKYLSQGPGGRRHRPARLPRVGADDGTRRSKPLRHRACPVRRGRPPTATSPPRRATTARRTPTTDPTTGAGGSRTPPALVTTPKDRK